MAKFLFCGNYFERMLYDGKEARNIGIYFTQPSLDFSHENIDFNL